MSAARAEAEQKTAAVLLIVFAALLLGMVVWEMILVGTNPRSHTLVADFIEKADLNYVMPLFLGYLVIGAAGLGGTIGVIQVYSPANRLLTEILKLAALAYFLCSYWLWAAVWIVQHKITNLTDRPTDPPGWLLEIFDASDSLWSLPSWGSLGPALILFAGMWWSLTRGARLLPRVAGWFFFGLAVSRFLGLLFIAVSGQDVANRGGFDFGYVNDLFFMVAQLAGFVLAAAALYTERGVFVRTRRS